MIPLLQVSYEPWWAQRLAHRSRAVIRVVVAGRQTGKTLWATREVVKLLCLRPRTQSLLLMPTKKSTVGPLRHLRAALVETLGPEGGRWTWRSQEAFFRLWNGAELYVRTCDSEAKEGMPSRGLTIDGVLWVDEAAYVPRSAWDAARGTQLAVKDPRVIVTTTPCGRNWVWEEFQSGVPGPKKSPQNESFRFKSSQSPFTNAAMLEDMKRKWGAKRALQELEAVFLGDGGSVFSSEEIERLVLPGWATFRGEQRTIGFDLGKERDFIVATLMNEWGEAWILWRARGADWNDAQDRMVRLANEHEALCVVDLGAGGGYGGMISDRLKRDLGPGRVLDVRTANRGAKSQIVEQLQSDVQGDRVKLYPGDDLLEIAKSEFKFFEGVRQQIAGVEVWTYSGPKSEKKGKTEDGSDEDHDDVVVSACLANHGRVHGWEKDTGAGGIEGFQPRSPAAPSGGGARPRFPGTTSRRGGYMIR